MTGRHWTNYGSFRTTRIIEQAMIDAEPAAEWLGKHPPGARLPNHLEPGSDKEEAMSFEEWLQLMGCEAEIIHEDDGSGYYVVRATHSAFGTVDLTVNGVTDG
jgi:hypothetical protein